MGYYMNLKKTVKSLCLGAMLLATGCATTDAQKAIMNSKHDLGKGFVSRVGYVEQFVTTPEIFHAYLQNANGLRLNAWEVCAPKGTALYAEGTACGMHRYEITTDPSLFDGKFNDGPTKADAFNYEVKKIQ